MLAAGKEARNTSGSGNTQNLSLPVHRIYCLRKENLEQEQASEEGTGTLLQGKTQRLLVINTVDLWS